MIAIKDYKGGSLMKRVLCFIICFGLISPGYGQNLSNIRSLLSEDGQVLYGNEQNSIMVMDYPENLQRIEEYLSMVDVSPQQVHIEARVVEVKLEGEHSLGVNWNLFTNQQGLRIGDVLVNSSITSACYQSITASGISSLGHTNSLGLFQDVLPWKNTFYPPNTATNQENPFTITLSNANIDVIVRALANTLDTNVLSAPSITTLNNRDAEIRIVETHPYAEPNAQIIENVGLEIDWDLKEKQSGIVLLVTPTISEDGNIIMDIVPEISEKTSDFLLTQTFSSGDVVTYSYPVIETRQAQTKVMVGNKQTLIIGGLIKNNDTTGESKIPLLGDIPFLGSLFKSTRTTREKSELIIFISPTIITPKEIAYSTKSEKRIRPKVSGEKTKLKITPFREVVPLIDKDEVKESKEEDREQDKKTLSQKVKSLYGEAVYLCSNNEPDKAKGVCAEILQLDPGHKGAQHYLEVKIPDKIRQREKSKKRQEEQKLKKQLSGLYSKALSLYRKKDYPQALEAFREIEKIKPGYSNTARYIETISGVLKDKKKVITAAPKESTEVDTQEGESDLAETKKVKEEAKQEELARKQQALKNYKQALSLYRQKQYSQAYDKFKQVQSIYPGYSKTAAYLTKLPALIKKQEEEARVFEEAKQKELELGRQAGEAYRQALSLYRQKQYSQAYDKFKQVQSILPGYAKTKSYISRLPDIIEKEFRMKEAEEARQKELELKQQAAEVYREALALYRQKQYTQAQDKFKQVQSILPGYANTEGYIESIPEIIAKQEQARLLNLEEERHGAVKDMLDLCE